MDSKSLLPKDPLSFILRHVLGVDEIQAEGGLTQIRKQNLCLLKENIGDSFVGKLIQSIGFEHYILPSGSNFEDLSLPHINMNIWGSAEESNTEKEAFISDVDFMCVFQEPVVTETFPVDSYIDLAFQGEVAAEHDKTTKNAEPSQNNLSNKPSLIMLQSPHPGFYKLKSVNPNGMPSVWRDMLIQDGLDLLMSASKFSSHFHKLGIQYYQENPNRYHDANRDPNIHGPALKIPIGSKDADDQFRAMLSEDVVWSLECSRWPPEAKPWLSRQRKSGWPAEVLLNELCGRSCHLVPVPHKISIGTLRDIEWRLSFSQVEAILAKNITWEQRKCYMILKGLHYTHFSQPKSISTYHLKTALFWLLEEEPESCFTNQTLSRSFTKLVDKVLAFLRKRNWPHYFLPENNMISHVDETELCQIEEKVGYVRYNLLRCLQECENILVGRKSFENNFSPVMKVLTIRNQNPTPIIQPYIDSVLNIANFYLVTGSVRLAMVYFEEALAYSEEGLKQDPSSFADIYQELLVLLKDHCVEIGSIDKAIQYSEVILNKSVTKDMDLTLFPDMEDQKSVILANLGCLYHIKYADQNVSEATTAEPDRKRVYIKAVECFDKAVSCTAVSPLARLEYGNFLCRNGEYEKARKFLSAALEELYTQKETETAVDIALSTDGNGITDMLTNRADGMCSDSTLNQGTDGFILDDFACITEAKVTSVDLKSDGEVFEKDGNEITGKSACSMQEDKTLPLEENTISATIKGCLYDDGLEADHHHIATYDNESSNDLCCRSVELSTQAKYHDATASEISNAGIMECHDEESTDSEISVNMCYDTSVELKQIDQAIYYGEFERNTVDTVVREIIQTKGLFQAPAIVYGHYLLACCLAQTSTAGEATAELPKLYSALAVLVKHDPSNVSTACSLELSLALCKELEAADVLIKIKNLKEAVGGHEESLEYLSFPTILPTNPSEERDDTMVPVMQLLKSHLIATKDQFESPNDAKGQESLL